MRGSVKVAAVCVAIVGAFGVMFGVSEMVTYLQGGATASNAKEIVIFMIIRGLLNLAAGILSFHSMDGGKIIYAALITSVLCLVWAIYNIIGSFSAGTFVPVALTAWLFASNLAVYLRRDKAE